MPYHPRWKVLRPVAIPSSKPFSTPLSSDGTRTPRSTPSWFLGLVVEVLWVKQPLRVFDELIHIRVVFVTFRQMNPRFPIGHIIGGGLGLPRHERITRCNQLLD